MKRDPYWKGRLERWQLWVFTAPGGMRSAFYVERVDCAHIVGALTPAINDEAIVTDQLVARLPKPLLQTVKAIYLDRFGRSRGMIAELLGITERTLHNRECQADVRLDILLDEHRAAHKRAA